MPNNPGDIIDFWLGPPNSSAADFKAKEKLWYFSTPELDDDIRSRFGEDLTQAEHGNRANWETTPDGVVALVILFDQFSRNLYRGTPNAFKNDARAFALAKKSVESGDYYQLPPACRILLIHPFHHAEDAAAQDRTVELYEELAGTTTTEWSDLIENHLNFAREHRETVVQFGRFPHRNATMGRESTEAELAFLRKDSRSYGQ